MGVDAEMLVTTPKPLTEREVRRLSYEVVSAFGTSAFWMNRDKGEHALRALPLNHYRLGDVSLPEGTQTALHVSLAGRYYGIGYERGDWPFYSNLRRWFVTRMPECTVFYGGDEANLELTEERDSEIWQHFAVNQHAPYRLGFDITVPGEPVLARHCDFCDEPMVRYSFGRYGQYGAFSCSGCGWTQKTEDGGETWRSDADR